MCKSLYGFVELVGRIGRRGGDGEYYVGRST